MPVAFFILFKLNTRIVLTAVNFDDEALAQTHKIEDVSVARNLSSKVMTA